MAKKFGTAKIECNFEMDKYKPLGVLIILLMMVQTQRTPTLKTFHSVILKISMSLVLSECVSLIYFDEILREFGIIEAGNHGS